MKSFFLFVLATAAIAQELIIDNDGGIDDALAILYLLNQSQLNVKAITIASDGGAHCQAAQQSMQRLLALTHHALLPIACGRTKPLSGNHHFSKSVRDEADTLAGAVNLLPTIIQEKPSASAIKILGPILQKAQRPLDIVALGPLTNIAQLLEIYPSLKNKIHKIYFMGGAIQTPGNLFPVDTALRNHQAEWNIYLDPRAAARVFQSGISVVLVPLDVTQKFPLDDRFYQYIKNTHTTPTTQWIYQLLQHNSKAIRNHQWYFWDPLAAMVASDEKMATFKTQRLRILVHPEEKSGVLVIDSKKGNFIQVCQDIDKNKFEKKLQAIFN